MRELSSLTGLQVISTSEGKKLGSVADAYVDLAAGELVCVTLSRTPELRAILAADIDVIGADAIMVADHSKLKSREEVGDELERGKRVLSSPPTVITSQGKTLGQLGTVQIDEGSKKVIRCEVTGGPVKDVTEGVLALPILDGIVHGQDTVIVPHDVVARRLVQSGGLRGALRNLGERLKVSVDDISERSGEFVRESEQKIKERAGEARKMAGEATEKAKERAGEAREKAGDAAEKARQRVSEVAEDAKHVMEHEKPGEAPEPPDEEPDAPRMEDPQSEKEDAVSPDDGEETHLVPGTATPLPEGEESAEEAEEPAKENAAEEPSSEDEDDEENNRDEA
ncbi:MAG: PRC-barrel domain-containing protein [Armatimonadota bacterium]